MKTLILSMLLLATYQANACRPPPRNAFFARSVQEVLSDATVNQLLSSYRITGIHENDNGTFAILAGNCTLDVDVDVRISSGPHGHCGGPIHFSVKPIGQVTCLP